MKNFLKISLFAFLAFGLFSCEDLREEFNEVNPNDPTDAPANIMLPGLVTGTQFFHSAESARTAGMWAGYFTGSDRQYISYQNYNVTAGDFDSPWRVLYTDIFDVAEIIREKAAAANQKDILGIASICEAHALGTAADLWGNIPYSTAGDPVENPEPTYDAQADVYNAVQTLLDEGIANASGTAAFAGSTSLGDWGEVASTLKARNYLHVGAYRDAVDAAANGISSAANDWLSVHDAGNLDAWNVYYNFCEFERNGYMTANTAHLVGLLDTVPGNTAYRGDDKTDESARFAWYYVKQFEVYQAYADPNTVDGMYTPGASFPLVTYVENELIAAEGNARLGEMSLALDHLNNARAANDAFYGAGDGSTYAAYEMADFANDAALLDEIIEEKYVSMYGQIEGFTDLRRTDNVIGVPSNNPALGSNPPERFFYPQSEINSNSNAPSPIPGLFEPTPVNQ